ncbi:hypothetical protein BD779DRAFT_1789028 [Infundibulicybe gibba]|nr:hypothetical protein BD779DRAFT_1789028 [Infundibulicybe gibba]
MSGKLVLVTGVSGFIAGHVADALLEAGYRVRGTARGAKVAQLTAKNKVSGLEFAQVDDVATSDITDALKGVDILMHVASPLAGKAPVDDTLNTAIDGTLNVLKQAAAAGIEKMVVTSSFGTLKPAFAGLTLSEKDWGEVTREEVHAKADDPLFVYFASKILAERAAWNFAKENPRVDLATDSSKLTTISPPGFVFGPFSPNYPLPTAETLGTNGLIYALMTGGHPPGIPPFFVDVRDVAKGHVLALNQPRKPLEEKRYIVNAANYPWKDAVADVTAKFPQVLGIKWIAPKKTMEDAVNTLLECQKVWKA